MTNFKQLRNRSITALKDTNELLIKSRKLLLLADQLNKELFDKLKGGFKQMNTQIRTYETKNNTYHIIKSAKTSYEQQEERKAERNFMIMQKAIGLLFILACIILFKTFPDPELRGCIVFVGLPIGLLVTLTKDHVICI